MASALRRRLDAAIDALRAKGYPQAQARVGHRRGDGYPEVYAQALPQGLAFGPLAIHIRHQPLSGAVSEVERWVEQLPTKECTNGRS